MDLQAHALKAGVVDTHGTTYLLTSPYLVIEQLKCHALV